MGSNAAGAKESASLIAKYFRRLEQEMPILNPMELIQLIFKLSNTGNPGEILDSPIIPVDLKILYTEARIAIDRYHAVFADFVLHNDPNANEKKTHPTNVSKYAVRD